MVLPKNGCGYLFRTNRGLHNIKLDKTGGLTKALALKKLAQSRGYEIMAGCMMGSSLAVAPALLVAQGADVVDLVS